MTNLVAFIERQFNEIGYSWVGWDSTFDEYRALGRGNFRKETYLFDWVDES